MTVAEDRHRQRTQCTVIVVGLLEIEPEGGVKTAVMLAEPVPALTAIPEVVMTTALMLFDDQETMEVTS